MSRDWVLPSDWLPIPATQPHPAAIRAALVTAFERHGLPLLQDATGAACLALVTTCTDANAFASMAAAMLTSNPVQAANMLADLGAIRPRDDFPDDCAHSELDDIEKLPLAAARAIVGLMLLRDVAEAKP